MAKSKKTQSNQTKESGSSFEESLTELQEIVNELEEGTFGLEQSMQRFEKGISLLQICYKILEKVEQKIEVMTGIGADGNPVTAPFEEPDTVEKPHTANARKTVKVQKPSSRSIATDNRTAMEESEGQLF